MKFAPQKLLNWQARKLRDHYGSNPERQFAATVLSFMLLSCTAIVSLFTIQNIFADASFMDARSKSVFIPMEIVIITLTAWAYTALIRGNYALGRLMFTSTAIGATFFAILMTGGFPKSVAAPSIITLPIIVVCLHGKTAGLRAAILLPVAGLLQWIFVHMTGLQLPNFESQATHDLNPIMVLTLTYALIVVIVLGYAGNAHSLREKLDAERKKLAKLANLDGLTGLFNSRYFNDEMDQSIKRSHKDGTNLVVFYLDLDRFKPINDTYGHEAGDAVLQIVSERLRNCVREHDVVARMGGDEFAILLRADADPVQVETVLDRVRETVTEPIEVDGLMHHVGTSIGIAKLREDGTGRSELIRAADRSMYADKAIRQTRRQHASSGNVFSLKSKLANAS